MKGLKPPINITPVSLTIPQGGKDSFVISSGKAPYRLRPGWGPVDITLGPPTGEPAKVDVVVGEGVATGDYGLTVRDDAGSEASVAIHVTAKGGTRTTMPDPSGVNVGRAQGEIKNALNAKLPGTGWGIEESGGKPAPWQSASKGDRTSVFTLRFATAEAADAADRSPNAQRIRDLSTVKANRDGCALDEPRAQGLRRPQA